MAKVLVSAGNITHAKPLSIFYVIMSVKWRRDEISSLLHLHWHWWLYYIVIWFLWQLYSTWWWSN